MGDLLKFTPGQKLTARFPAACRIRLMSGGKVVAEERGENLEFAVDGTGRLSRRGLA